MKKYLIIALLIFVQFFPQKIEERKDSLVSSGISQIYSLRFSDAYSTFSKLRNEMPNNPAPYFFDAMVLWWQILLDLNNNKFDELFYIKLDVVIEKCDKILDKDENNFEALFYKAGALGFRGRLLSVREQWLEAALDGKDALPIVLNLNYLYPQNYDIYLGLGIYNYYAEVVPENYPFVKPFMYLFPPGNRELGIEQLELVAAKGKNAIYETQYFLSQIYLSFEKDFKKALFHSKSLSKQFPQNPKFENLVARSLFGGRQFEKADSVFRGIIEKCDSNKFGYIQSLKASSIYYIADIQFRKRNLEKADSLFKESITLFDKINPKDDSPFKVNATIYRGIIKKRQKKYDEALKIFETIFKMKEYKNSHERAEKEIKKIKKQ